MSKNEKSYYYSVVKRDILCHRIFFVNQLFSNFIIILVKLLLSRNFCQNTSLLCELWKYPLENISWKQVKSKVTWFDGILHKKYHLLHSFIHCLTMAAACNEIIDFTKFLSKIVKVILNSPKISHDMFHI